jgi:nucleotide-binding universal stress UspA family protein
MREERRTMDLMRGAKSRLDDVARSMRRELGGSAVTAEVVANEYVAEAILERARHVGVGLIALASRGRGGSRLLVGSVADKVLRGFTGALLVLGPVAARELESDELPIEQEAAVGSH